MKRNLFVFILLTFFLSFKCTEDNNIEETFGPELLKIVKDDHNSQNP